MHATVENNSRVRLVCAIFVFVVALAMCAAAVVFAANKTSEASGNSANIAKFSTSAVGEQGQSFTLNLSDAAPSATYPFKVVADAETNLKYSVTVVLPENCTIPANVLSLTVSDAETKTEASTVAVDTATKGTTYTFTNENWCFDINDKSKDEEDSDQVNADPFTKDMVLQMNGTSSSSTIMSTLNISGIEVYINYEQTN